ncbi:MAG: D-glycerate dehydrogenase [Candidatus Lloydbacteria bacterium RIFCSPHIGHO2_01_FULL_49_22]|uniref:D-glycerate dehydrogenase n=1 Tax=Candidatus Lloydbacteria bacterium RIFCSPHIGHO2_01_FULL_49_22 TaxID=1798658 RepID=A0A1G2CX67_9BACT|nr:MAG: D-glycerate dehydrogenase [Candidatus Lloydbacteria bacterium RIFCSPHIGHO2_01_FULL_49_22]OGZ09030.1 MAG: D-glycerate dehydrogenase [Candidatus Lloydbacteria bacterium RIFCSPHIGHO2_02_FULL_50_18]
MPTIYVTRRIPELGLSMLRDKGFTLDVSEKDGVLTRDELLGALRAKPYDGVLSLLTDTIDAEVYDAVPTAKIFANYAVGFNNIDIPEAKKRGIVITNTPGALTNTVAEHAMALILACTTRTVEGDRLTRAGKYEGWGPMMLLGMDLAGKTLGVLGAGRIGSRLAHHAKDGFDMNVIYYDVKQNPDFEKATGARFCATVEEVLRDADVVSIHVPLLDSTKHLMNAERLAIMKNTAYLVNTSRGPVIDEVALVAALRAGVIAGAGIDVYEHEPALAPGLAQCANAVLTPHIASASVPTRDGMARLAAENLIAFFEGKTPPNAVQ